MESEDRTDSRAGTRLFVYGTLRKGFRSHELLRRLHARLLGTGTVRGRLYDLGKYPGALEKASDSDRIHGEIYLLPQTAAAFRVLDRFEGFDTAKPVFNLFERRETVVTLAGGREMRAWIYWLPRPPVCGRRLPSGNYALRRT